MGTLGRVAAISLVAVGVVGAASGGTVQIYAGGKLRGAFTPRVEPYTTDGPSVSVYLEKHDVKTADGQVVTGLEFIGWQEGQGVRIEVFLLVPGKWAANTYMPEGKPEQLARRPFGSFLLAKGDDLAIDKMQKLGVEPMKLRVR